MSETIQIQIGHSAIDDFDRRLLFELDINCRRSSKELSEVLGKSRQAVEYRISRLQELGVLKNFHTIFNASKMGMQLYKFHLKLRDIPHERQRLIEYLRASGSVYWIGESSGTWDLLFSVFFTKKSQLLSILNEIDSDFSAVVVQIDGHLMYEIQQFPKCYLTNELRPAREHTGPDIEHARLQTEDYRILAELVKNARAPIKQLAEQAGCSAGVASRRIAEMERLGIIVQYRVGVDHELLGFSLYKAILRLRGHTDEEHQRFFSFISQFPELQFYVRNIWSVELELLARNFEAYQQIMDKIKSAFPRLIDTYDTLLLKTDEWTSAFCDHLQSV